jgi:hypothetical protein
MGKGGDDAVDEGKIILCCALGCCNLGLYNGCDAIGCSGKAGLCCINMECCCKGGAPFLLPFGCLGLRCECDGCSLIDAQVRDADNRLDCPNLKVLAPRSNESHPVLVADYDVANRISNELAFEWWVGHRRLFAFV